MELTPSISEYLDKKLKSLEKFVSRGSEAIARVEVGRSTKHHNKGDVHFAEINLDIDGKKFRAVVEGNDLYRAIDEVKDEIVGEVTRASKKAKHLAKRGSQKIKRILKRD